MRVCGRGDLRSRLVNMTMDSEGGSVQQSLALNDIALVTHPDQIGHAHQFEGTPHGVDPECVGINGITNRDVARDPFIKTEFAKNAECCSETLLALELLRGRIQPLAGHRRQIGIHHQLINLFVHDCSLLFSRQCRAASRASSPAVGNDSPRAER